MNIDVVLLQDDPKLGKRGEVVKVSSGYAQNFLYPHNKAKPATPDNLKVFQAEKVRHDKEEAQKQSHARDLAAKLKDYPLTIEVTSGEGDKLYGAVNSQDIAEALAKKGFSIERREIHLDDTIKKLGTYPVTIKLHKDMTVRIQVQVASKGL